MELAQHFVEQYGYWAVFIWTFIEGESVFIAAAALSAAGLLHPSGVIAAAAAGAYAGHLFFFTLGRWRGMDVINALPFLRRHYPKANVILDKYAHWSIFIFQYLYGTRIVAAILFGCSSISTIRFLLLQIVNCLTWSIAVYTAGHLLGLAALAVLHRFGIMGLILTLLLAGAAGLWLYFHYGHRHVRAHMDREGKEADSIKKDS